MLLRAKTILVLSVQGTILKFIPNGTSTTFATGFPANFFLQAVVFDGAGNLFVMAQSDANGSNPNPPSNIYKITPDGTVSIFAPDPITGFTNPGFSHGLAFDGAGNLYAADNGDQKIFKYTPGGVQSTFVGPAAFSSGKGPVGLAFDGSGNLFVSTEDIGNVANAGVDAILKFAPDGTETPFFTGLLTNYPRGIAFDTVGNLFVAEVGIGSTPGDILEFTPGGTEISPLRFRNWS